MEHFKKENVDTIVTTSNIITSQLTKMNTCIVHLSIMFQDLTLEDFKGLYSRVLASRRRQCSLTQTRHTVLKESTRWCLQM